MDIFLHLKDIYLNFLKKNLKKNIENAIKISGIAI